MGIEIERKFLVTSDAYQTGANVSLYRQGYMLNSREKIVRVRVYDGKGALTVKGPATRVTRAEFEYPIPFEDANEMLNLYCDGAVLEKERYTLEWGGFFWEVDVFHGENEGLVVAEIELDDESTDFPKPDWLGREVSHDERYFNSNLLTYPYMLWADCKPV